MADSRQSTSQADNTSAQQSSAPARNQSKDGKEAKHVHHGRTPAAWTGSIMALVGFLLGGIALLGPNWTLFTIAAVICALALVATAVMQRMGYGAD
jgi:hypothetical protein